MTRLSNSRAMARDRNGWRVDLHDVGDWRQHNRSSERRRQDDGAGHVLCRQQEHARRSVVPRLQHATMWRHSTVTTKLRSSCRTFNVVMMCLYLPDVACRSNSDTPMGKPSALSWQTTPVWVCSTLWRYPSRSGSHTAVVLTWLKLCRHRRPSRRRWLGDTMTWTSADVGCNKNTMTWTSADVNCNKN